MARGLFIMLWIGMAVYGITDIINTPAQRCRYLSKSTWAVIALIVPIVGTAAWLYFGKVRVFKSRPRQVAPDDDPDYLASLRKRPNGPVAGPSHPARPATPPPAAPPQKGASTGKSGAANPPERGADEPRKASDEDRDGDQAARSE